MKTRSSSHLKFRRVALNCKTGSPEGTPKEKYFFREGSAISQQHWTETGPIAWIHSPARAAMWRAGKQMLQTESDCIDCLPAILHNFTGISVLLFKDC